MYMGVLLYSFCSLHAYLVHSKAEEGVGSPRTGVTGSLELYVVGGNVILGFLEDSQCC